MEPGNNFIPPWDRAFNPKTQNEYIPDNSIYYEALNNNAVYAYNSSIGDFEIKRVPMENMREYKLQWPEEKYVLTDKTVSSVCYYREGENEEEPWLIIGKFKSNEYFYFIASCDYTGFDCQGGGELVISPTWDILLNNISLVHFIFIH